MSRGSGAARGGSPCGPDFPKSPITAGPRTPHYAAQGRKVVAFVMGPSKGEVEAKPPLDITLTVSVRPLMFCMDSGSDSDIMSHGAP